MNEALPTQIKLHQKSRSLEIHFDGASSYELPCEYLRVFSPSAEVRAAKNRGECIVGKQSVAINRVEPVGQSELLTITVNKQFAAPTQLLNAGDEIALVPRATAG